MSLDILSEVCLTVPGKNTFLILRHYLVLKYCERCLKKGIACINRNNGEDALFSQDCSRSTHLTRFHYEADRVLVNN